MGPQNSLHEAFEGWRWSDRSKEWLYNMSTGVYFHSPTETLWMLSHNGPKKNFIRVDTSGQEGKVAIVCGMVTYARIMLRVCLFPWRRQLRKFEDMDSDLV